MLCLQAQKDYKFKLVLLDDREFKFSYKSSQKCEQILIDVAKILNLEERDYFGFRYLDSDMLSVNIVSFFFKVYLAFFKVFFYYSSNGLI